MGTVYVTCLLFFSRAMIFSFVVAIEKVIACFLSNSWNRECRFHRRRSSSARSSSRTRRSTHTTGRTKTSTKRRTPPRAPPRRRRRQRRQLRQRRQRRLRRLPLPLRLLRRHPQARRRCRKATARSRGRASKRRRARTAWPKRRKQSFRVMLMSFESVSHDKRLTLFFFFIRFSFPRPLLLESRRAIGPLFLSFAVRPFPIFTRSRRRD